MIRPKPTHAFCNDVMADLDAVGLAELIRTGQVSTREVAAAAISRAMQVNPHINAVQLDSYEQAMQTADTARQGLFAGVPTFVKDNTDLQGLPTNHGSVAVNSPPAKSDNAFAKQFLAQGFVVLGKSKLPEFGLNASTEYQDRPPTRNPWHLDYSCGGSSGGAAALVAAGVVPIAHGNDGGGSIRIPAACCGLIGLKPTRGRLIDGEAARTLPLNIVSEGVLTRSVRDTAHFYAGAEHFFRNSTLTPIGLVTGPSARRLRVGLVVDSITGHATDTETRHTVSETARLLESMGHHVTQATLPIDQRFATDFGLYWGLIALLISVFGKRLSPNIDAARFDMLSKGLAAHCKKNLIRTPGVLYRLRKSRRDYAQYFSDYDVILSPVLAHATPQLGYLSPNQDFDELFDRLTRYVSFTPWNNAAGGPAISLPLGATTDGLPIAVHFSATHGDERTLLELAFELEQAKPWRRIQDVHLS